MALTHESQALMNQEAGKVQASLTGFSVTSQLASQGFIQPLAGVNSSMAVTTLKQWGCNSWNFGQRMKKEQRVLQAS